jgi:hypothetical protein
MADRIFEDDPTIPDEERLLRRIPPAHLVPNENQGGKLRVSSGAFRKKTELSVILESPLLDAGRQPADLLRNYPSHLLVAITARIARAHQQSVARDPEPEEPAHGVVYGKKPSRCANALAGAVEWVVPPEAPTLPVQALESNRRI